MAIEPQEVERLIHQGVALSQVKAIDLTGTRDHYKVVVVSESFKDLRLVRRHQMINDSLKEPLKGPLHALTIEAYTPDEFAAKGGVVSERGPEVQMLGQIKL